MEEIFLSQEKFLVTTTKLCCQEQISIDRNKSKIYKHASKKNCIYSLVCWMGLLLKYYKDKWNYGYCPKGSNHKLKLSTFVSEHLTIWFVQIQYFHFYQVPFLFVVYNSTLYLYMNLYIKCNVCVCVYMSCVHRNDSG